MTIDYEYEFYEYTNIGIKKLIILIMGSIVMCKCNDCQNEFRTNLGDGALFYNFHCLDCDNIKSFPRNDFSSDSVKACEKCGGKLTHQTLKPMCPNCQSRNTEEIQTVVKYD